MGRRNRKSSQQKKSDWKRLTYFDLTIKPPRSSQRRVNSIRAIRSSNHNHSWSLLPLPQLSFLLTCVLVVSLSSFSITVDTLLLVQSVHEHQQSCHYSPLYLSSFLSVRSQRIDFINHNHRRTLPLRLRKHFPQARLCFTMVGRRK